MIPTKQNCLDAARFYLADDLISGGQDFTNTALEQPFQMAVRELHRAMKSVAIPRVERTAYYNLPANTSFLSPATAGITDLGELEFIAERGNLTTVNITNAVNGAGFVTITAVGHPYATGDQAAHYGITGMSGVNNLFTVTVVDPNTYKANGAVGVGTYSSGGVSTKSGDQFSPVQSVNNIGKTTVNNSELGFYAQMEEGIFFPPCGSMRQLRIIYISSAALVVNAGDTIGIDDSVDFVAVRTAGLAAGSRIAGNRGQELNVMALGPTMQADASGGILRDVLQAGVRALQATPTQRPPFRLRVNPDAQNFL
jgi:hypothetical protein